MTGSSTSLLAPLPQAPTATHRSGMTVDGAARSAWRPNVFAWVAIWRALILGELIVTVAAGLNSGGGARTALLSLAGWTLVTTLLALRPPGDGLLHRGVLAADLVAGCSLLALAPDRETFALLALASCSTVVSWAAGRPVDAFVAAGLAASAYAAGGLVGPYADARPAEFVGNLSMYAFFALATSGFFTVTHRIGALEIATEISRERGRYRRDLHDRLGQALCGLHFEVQAVHAVGLDEQAPNRMRSLADGYRDAHAMLADLFRGGDEPMLGTNVASVIQQEARRMAQQVGMRIDVTVTGDAGRVPPAMRPHVAAIAGEAMHNSVKNGHAQGIDIDIDVTDQIVVVSVTDDGVGFDNPPGTITEKEGHYGLREMAERARICGGEVVIASQPGFGTRVRLQVPLPEGATEDILERDASRLRGNVWSLFLVLRTMLGVVAAAQLAVAGRLGSEPVAAAMLALMALDLVLPASLSGRARRFLQGRPEAVAASIAGYGALLVVSLLADVVPYFMLYAPLVLLAVGVVGGRRVASRATWAFGIVVVAVVAACALIGRVSSSELDAALVYVTTLALVGMCAVQGAKLLDRLETLQIRVRYQVLARMRQGLGTRTRDQLVERLDELEATARALAASSPSTAEFATATARLQHESSELKKRLREIVHTLADPTPGRTPAHV